jgi:mRNA-degrading endonuclease toxin of MazEF toxin-antitoxin module
VLILKVYNKETALIIPLTSKLKDGKYYITLEFKGRFSTITLSQARTISTKRLSRKIGIISKNNFCVVRKKFIESI